MYSLENDCTEGHTQRKVLRGSKSLHKWFFLDASHRRVRKKNLECNNLLQTHTMYSLSLSEIVRYEKIKHNFMLRKQYLKHWNHSLQTTNRFGNIKNKVRIIKSNDLFSLFLFFSYISFSLVCKQIWQNRWGNFITPRDICFLHGFNIQHLMTFLASFIYSL